MILIGNMVSKYDVFTKIIEKSPCKHKDLGFKKPTYYHVKDLIRLGYIKETNKGFIPIKNEKTSYIFEIIKTCIKGGLDYNLLLTKEVPQIIKELNDNLPELRPQKLRNNESIKNVLKYLEQNQFILVRKNKPKLGTLLNHSLIENIFHANSLKKIDIKENFSKSINKQVLQLHNQINPFADNYFASLSGSVQLEGGTVTMGETIEMLTKEIYPDKSSKDIQMVKNLNEGMHFIIENLNKPLTIEIVKEINLKVMFSLHRNAGKFKLIQNKIKGNPSFKTTQPHLIGIELEKFCKEFNSIKTREECIEKIGFIHNFFQRIHPFSDGNSRTTRIIVNFLLAKFEFPLIIFKEGSFEAYMNLTKLSKKQDDENLNQLLLHILLHESLIN